ncbi:MAG TPA: polysaccharide biosynthesis/export family protein, partial [Gammaproteobacteria bacterium]|nr:polysaccharide biosynthesis/export family protein [Gammaproteobacteria bacterium]
MNAGTNAVSIERDRFARAFLPVGAPMTLAGARHTFLGLVVGLTAGLSASVALAQVPLPMQEQIRLFNSLPPAQQQSLIRELQRSLPPAQREAIVGMLTGSGQPTTELALDTEAALADALAAQPAGEDRTAEPRQPRLRPRDTLVLRFELADGAPLVMSQQARDEFRERLAKGNPYQLDGAGMLYLPGVPAIALAGLNVDEATVRVQAETALRPFDVILTFLPLTPVGTDALEPFGYDLFERVPSTFAPATDIPVPVDYVIGPGDTVNVQLFGNQNDQYFLPVSREGSINFPAIGPITVSGLSFAQMRDTINDRVAQQMIGTRASITLGELRSIRVLLLGDVTRPGSYTVSGLSTMTNALFAGGGVKTIGSLRNVALRRDGDTVSTLDVYDLLLRGDTRGDARLQSG